MGDRVAKDALYDGFAHIARALGSGRRAELIDILAQAAAVGPLDASRTASPSGDATVYPCRR